MAVPKKIENSKPDHKSPEEGPGSEETVVAYVCSTDILRDLSAIAEAARDYATNTVNRTLVERNWLLGKRIVEEGLNGELRAAYGQSVIAELAKQLTDKFGKGFTRTNLYSYVRFYKYFPEIFHTVCGKSASVLSWSHYRVLLQVHDERARQWYAREALDETWSVRTLQRNVSSQYYYRILKSRDPQAVGAEMRSLTGTSSDRLEFVKNPVVTEFLGFSDQSEYPEADPETSILNNLQRCLLELGKGYAFVARHQRIHTEKEDYYIDLVFYNFKLKCFVLIDLKTSKVTHQDVRQMDMYVRMYDERHRGEGDNPTLGILLCADTDEDIARYSILHGSEQLFASKYLLYLPTEEELRAEIDTQKTLFLLQRDEKDTQV